MASKGKVEYFYEHRGERCGYCKAPASMFNHYMQIRSMSPEVYGKLIDRGWRRSGDCCYKPMMKKTCCLPYGIKLDISKFKLSNSHKKTLKKVHRFLATGKMSARESPPEGEGIGDGFSPEGGFREKDEVDIDAGSDDATGGRGARATQPRAQLLQWPKEQQMQGGRRNIAHPPSELPPKKGDGPDPNKPKCIKAKELRKRKKLQKLASKGEAAQPLTDKSNNTPKSIEDYLNEPLPENAVHRLRVVTVRSCLQSSEFHATLTESWKVYKNYQVQIHKDDESECDEEQYRWFLVDSPLRYEPNEAYGFGSFHQQYWLDDELIAVGVVDILPTCVSSVYLFYNPDYGFLSLGTYAALREIAFTRELLRTCPSITHYCMGFYIHTCPKMRYKGNFYPSYLLCPETYTWHPVEKCRLLLDKNKYVRFEEDASRDDDDKVSDIDKALILYDEEVLTYGAYRDLAGSHDRKEVEEYASLVGQECIESILLHREYQ